MYSDKRLENDKNMDRHKGGQLSGLLIIWDLSREKSRWSGTDTRGPKLRSVNDSNAAISDQMTTAKEEIVVCIKDVMEGERGNELKRNALKWKELAREAVNEGGSSDKNIKEFFA
ncbi:UDP-glycosyltransferase 74C1 [Vitis vinifera]|uniref:UDP-glycosyltransferase 74C1 n=1 Tax=Vitis vinifera TaxID=29760 RepID=A0A438GR68_VITVI|nr:UDP-glycosyltransferase 74C1 [Vitis vinifera]